MAVFVSGMKTLLTLFNKERSELETEVNQTTNSKQAVKLIQNKLDHLEKSYIGELNVRQVRLVKFLLDTLRQSLATLSATNETALNPPEQVISQADRSPNRFILKLLQGLSCIGILASLFSLTEATPAAWMTILLMFVLVGLEVVLRLDKDNDESKYSVPPQPIESQPPLDSKLLDNLANALESIDRAVNQVEVNKLPGPSGIEEMPEVLDFLQRLWGASSLGNPLMMLELTKLLPQILLEQGIQTQSYQPHEEHCRGYFDFEPNIDRSAKDYVTITPALLKGDRLLRRGRVIEPVSS